VKKGVQVAPVNYFQKRRKDMIVIDGCEERNGRVRDVTGRGSLEPLHLESHLFRRYRPRSLGLGSIGTSMPIIRNYRWLKDLVRVLCKAAAGNPVRCGDSRRRTRGRSSSSYLERSSEDSLEDSIFRGRQQAWIYW
jgi:hypothetical protein